MATNPFGPNVPGVDVRDTGPYESIQRQQPGSWIDGVGSAIALQPFWQAVGSTYDSLTAPEGENFSAYNDDYLKGYELYSSEFTGARSRYEGDRIKARIDRNEAYRAEVDNSLGFWGMLAAEVANPINYIPMPGLMGAGAVKGLLKGAASGLALGAGEELLRLGVDPTATTEEAVDNTVYGALFTGLLGGVVGRIGAKDVSRMTRGYSDYHAMLDRSAEGGIETVLQPDPVTSAGTAFVARPTGAAETGVKKAWGLEKQTLASFWGRLKANPVGAVGDFADAVLGDFGTMSARNMQGLPTQQSALLASARWQGKASAVIEDLGHLYSTYLGDGTPSASVFGLNLRTTASRIGETFRSTGRADGKLSYGEFKDAIFRAHKAEGIETDNPFVRKGVERVRQFYDEAMIDGVRTGAISSAEGGRKLMQRRVGMVRDRQRRFEELADKPNPTHNEIVEMHMIGQLQDRHIRELSRYVDRQLGDDPDIAKILDDLDEKFHAEAEANRTLRDQVLGSGVARRNAAQQLRDDIERSVEERIAKDRAVLAELNRKFETEGLNERQKAYRDDLENRVKLYDNEGVRGTARQQEVMEGIDAKLEASTAPKGWDVVEPGEDIWGRPVQTTPLPAGVLNVGTVPGALGWVVENSANDFHRLLSERLVALTEGIPIRTYGDDVPRETLIPGTSRRIDEVHGAVAHKDGQATVVLNTSGYARGNSEETLIHEALHAALAVRIGRLREVPLDQFEKATGFGEDARAFASLARRAQEAYLAPGADVATKLGFGTRGEMAIAFKNIDEFLTYALTNPEFAKWLDTIPARGIDAQTSKLSVWQKLTNMLFKMIGMDPKYEAQFKTLLESGTLGSQTAEATHRLLGRLEETTATPQKPQFGRKGLSVETEAAENVLPGTEPLPRGNRAEGPPSPEQARRFLTDRQLRLIDDLEERMAKDTDYTGPANEKNYLPRLWDLDKVVADQAGEKRLHGILTQWFTENPLPGASLAPEAIERRVNDALKSILKEAQTGDIQVGPTGFKSASAARKINIPNELVMDFIDTDIENVTRNYGTRFGTGTELARMFGTVDAEDSIDDVLLQAARELGFTDVGDGLKQIEALRQDLSWARDKMTGAVYSTDPAMMNKRRLVGGVRGWGTVTTLGKVALSSIPELGRAAMVLGFRRTFAHALDILNEPAAIGRELRSITNEGLDTLMSGGVDRFVEHGGPAGAATGLVGKAADRTAKFANGPFMLATFLPMLTDFQKRMNLSFINHFLMEDIHKVAAGKGTARDIQMLASYGLSADDAAKIVTMPIEKNGKFFLPNTGEWGDEQLALRYMGAVGGLSRRIVPTANLADIPEIAKGFIKGREYPLITMPFQFMNYGFSSANKVLLSAVQGRDQSTMAGMALILGLGYISTKLKSSDQQWQSMDAEERITRSVDASGITAIYSNVNTMVEAASLGRVGVRPALGMDPLLRDASAYNAATQLGGPVTSKIGQIAGLFIGDEPEAKDVSSLVRRSIPLNNLFYWDSLWKDAEKSMLDWGEEDTKPQPLPM
jgi:hypothetical protein